MKNPLVGIIGSGNIGTGVARLATAAGLNVVISNSRGPASLADLVAELGATASADTPAGVASRADIVVLAFPLAVYQDLPVAELAGRVVIDAMNYYPQYTGPIPDIDQRGIPSSQLVHEFLPGARVVKALNNVDYVRLTRLARPAGDPTRSALPIAGDDPQAKAQATVFLDAIGFDVLDLGGLDESWRTQPGTPLHVAPYSRDLPVPSEDPYTRFMAAETVPVPLAQAQTLAAQATRG